MCAAALRDAALRDALIHVSHLCSREPWRRGPREHGELNRMPCELNKKHATLVVCDGDNNLLGSFVCEVPLPWPQETSDVLAAARAAGLELAVLRLLQQHLDDATGVLHCTYLALSLQSGNTSSSALAPVPDNLLAADQLWIDHPLRLRYARPSGLVSDLAWADEQLAARGRRRSGCAQQQRTWNLSCVFRLQLDDGSEAWLKSVPPFFAHEGSVIDCVQRLDGDASSALATSALATLDGALRPQLRLPQLLAFDGAAGRLLMTHCEGPLMWGARPAAWRPIIAAHVDRQLRLQSHVAELFALGLPDWRASALLVSLRALCARSGLQSALALDVRSGLARLMASLPERLDALQACGLPDTLVHGDLHQGNVIASAAGPVLLDWGDAGVGMPLFDLPGLCHGFPADDQPQVRAMVADAWRRACPGARVDAAMRLIAPLAELRQALIYQHFLDNIEPAEHHYHAADVPARLTAAVHAAA